MLAEADAAANGMKGKPSQVPSRDASERLPDTYEDAQRQENALRALQGASGWQWPFADTGVGK